MTLEQAKATAKRFNVQAFSGDGDLGVIDELLSEQVVHRNLPPGSPPGIEGVRQAALLWRTAFPDLRITIDDALAQDDLVVVAWTGAGTHQGDLMGIPPTGKHASMSGITFNRIQDGKIVEIVGNNDDLGLLKAIGVVP